MIKKGLLIDQDNWGNTYQKTAPFFSDNLSIILYEELNADPAKWNKRINAVEVALFEAGVRPRALNKRSGRGSVVNDKKIPGAIYSFYKKDNDYNWDPNWEEEDYDYKQDYKIDSVLQENEESICSFDDLKKLTGQTDYEDVAKKINIVEIQNLFDYSNTLHSNYHNKLDPANTSYIQFKSRNSHPKFKYFKIENATSDDTKKIIQNIYSYHCSVGWTKDKGIVGQVNVTELFPKIKEKITLIGQKIYQNSSNKADLEKLKSSYEFYQTLSTLKHEDAQKIQHDKTQDGSIPEDESKGLKQELNEANHIIGEKHHLLNVEVKMANILQTSCQAIVNAGNYILDNGRYGISGLNKAIHDAIDGEAVYDVKEITFKNHNYYYKCKTSPLCDALVKNAKDQGVLDQKTQILVQLYKDKEFKNPLLEESQAKDGDDNLLYLDREGKVTKLTTNKLHFKQKNTSVTVNKLKENEVVLVDLKVVGGAGEESLKNKTVIHAVGPDYRKDDIKKLSSNARKRKLKEIYQKALDKAYDNGIKSIALPVLSVGVFNFPAKEAAEVVADILKTNCQRFDKIEVCDKNQDRNKQDQETEIIQLIKENLASSQSKPNYNLSDQLKSGFEKSLTPKRYQAALSILHRYCGVNVDSLTQGLQEYLDNAEKFKGINFDFDKTDDFDKDLESKRRDLAQFNKNCYDFFAKDSDEMWKKVAEFATNEAKAKDLLRIKEKFNFHKDDNNFQEIVSIFDVLYNQDSSNQTLEDSLQELKKIIICARLKKKVANISEKDANRLADGFINNNQNIDLIKKDPSLKDKISAQKIENIFSKFVSLGKIENIEDLKFRIYEKKVTQFQEKFSNEVLLLDEVKAVKMAGDEVVFRGISLPSQISLQEQEAIINKSFLSANIPQAKSATKNERQDLGSLQILKNRIPSPVGEGNRISYAVATSLNPKTAIEYATKSDKYGWIYEIRPQQHKNAVLIKGVYNEVDFSEIKPEEIYAAYLIEQCEDKETSKVTKKILNPQFKKRATDQPQEKLQEETDITRVNLLSKIAEKSGEIDKYLRNISLQATKSFNDLAAKHDLKFDNGSPSDTIISLDTAEQSELIKKERGVGHQHKLKKFMENVSWAQPPRPETIPEEFDEASKGNRKLTPNPDAYADPQSLREITAISKSDKDLIEIKTSGVNNWCGYFALANCLKYQPRYVKDTAYRNLGIDASEAIKLYYNELLTHFNTFNTANRDYDKNLKLAEEMPYDTGDQQIKRAARISELESIESEQFSTKTGFYIAEFKKLKALKENLDAQSPSGDLLQELEKISHNEENDKLYQFFIGGFIQKKYREEWKSIHQALRFEQIFNQCNSDQLVFGLCDEDNQIGMFAESYISLEQIKFLAQQLNTLFKVVENSHQQGNQNPISLECFSAEVAHFFNTSENKNQVILLLGNFLSASPQDLESGNFTINPNLNQESFNSGIESKFQEELEKIFYQILAVEAHVSSNFKEKGTAILKQQYEKIIDQATSQLKINYQDYQTAIDQASAKLKGKECNNTQDYLSIITKVVTDIDEDLPKITQHKLEVTNRIKEDIAKFEQAKEILTKTTEQGTNLLQVLTTAIQQNSVIELRISNPNVGHYTAMIPKNLHDSLGQDESRAEESVTKLRGEAQAQAQAQAQASKLRGEAQDKASKLGGENQNDGLVLMLYKKYYRTLFGNEFSSRKESRSEKLSELLDKFNKYLDYDDISGFALRLKDEDVRRDFAFKNNTMLHWAIANAENDIANVLINKINEKNFLISTKKHHLIITLFTY